MEQHIGDRFIVDQHSSLHRVMIIHTHYDEGTDTSGWAVVRTFPGMLECRTGSLPHTTAERALLSTLLRELFALSADASISVAMLTPEPVVLLHTCRPWVWRTQNWHEDGQPVANADLWALLLPEIDQRCVTWHLLTPNQRSQLDVRLAHQLARVAAQGDVACAVGDERCCLPLIRTIEPTHG